MLVDVARKDLDYVRAAGYRVTEGSLGTPLRVPAGSKLLPVPMTGRLPGFAEQEIVVLQQRASEPVDLKPEDVPTVTDATHFWAPTSAGVIDPRAVLAKHAAANTQRILEHGGVVIVFCDARHDSKLVFGKAGRGGIHVEGPVDWSVWDFVPELDSFAVEFDHGEEVTAGQIDALDVLVPHLNSAFFNCTLSPGWREEQWLVLATSKYGKAVAGALRTEPHEQPDGTQRRGWVFLLPQVQDVGGCVTAFLDHILPGLAPHLFPESDKTVWLHGNEYELPEVRRLNAEVTAVRSEAERQEQLLREAIDRQREQDGWMHTLLTGTGDTLVDAVKSALDDLGLQDVRKVDDEAEEAKTGRRREDIQVWGDSPVLLVEVKGITNLPRETNALQVTKYLIPRMRQWDRNDVRGLSVINQQRGLPALERENAHTFQQDVLHNAEEQGFGLITTVDLFRLVRNRKRWGWPDDTVVPLLYSDGRIPPIPLHYEPVGVIDGFFENAGVVAISVSSPFEVGDELAYQLPIDYSQETVPSMHLNGADVHRAEPGQRVGIKACLTREQARKGVNVYRVGRDGRPGSGRARP